MENKGAVERVENEHSPGYYSIIFVRPKKNGKLRPIIDLSRLNKHIITPTFRMENAQSIKAVLTQGQWVASIDLKDTYFHIPIKTTFRKYIRFCFLNQTWQFKALPFGLSVAPQIITAIMSLVEKLCHEQGIKIHYQWREDKPQEIHKVIQSTPEIDTILQWWTRPHLWNLSVPLAPLVAHLHLFTDASCQGWGAHMDSETASGVWSPLEKSLHINVLECRAVFLALQTFLPSVENRNVLIETNNTTTLAYINKEGGTRSFQVYMETRDLLLWCHEKNVKIRAVHIKGSLNVMADLLSRDLKTINTEWSVHPQVIKNIWKMWYIPDVDLFATLYNNKLPTHVRPFPDPKVLATDAITMDWTGRKVYAFTPFAILKKVIAKLEQSPTCEMILITPYWPNQSWYPVIRLLSQEPP